MELRHLRYFVTVAERGSVRLASEHLHVTQPAISRQIQDLEGELGLQLFERSPQGLRLTVAGLGYLQDVRQILALTEQATQAARALANGTSGRLRLGYVENTGWDGLLPTTFRRFRTEVPDVTLELAPRNSPEQLDRIARGALDGGFIYQYDSLPDSIATFPLLDNGVVLAVPRAWGLDAGQKSMSLASMRDRPFILFPREAYPAYYDRLMEACRQLGITPLVTQEADTEAAILSLVCAGMGAAIVNAANQGRPPAQVQFFTMTDLSIAMPLVFAYAREASNPVLPRFISILQAALDDTWNAAPAGSTRQP